MRKKIISVALFMCLLVGMFSQVPQEVSAASYETAWFPAPSMHITQIAYESYSHGSCNAIDISPGGNVFAPFTGKIVQLDSRWGFVLFQSTDKVYYADGSLDYMTVGFMHDSNISNLRRNQIITQGTAFYQAGGMGNGNPNAYGKHVDISVLRGRRNSVRSYGRGDTYAYDGFFINKSKTTINRNSNFGKVARGNRVTRGYSDWSNKWRYTTDTKQKTPTISGANVPTSLQPGQVYSIYGTISSESQITSVTAGVYTSKSGKKMVTGKTVSPNSTSYDLKNVDRYVYFNKLKAGTYYYIVRVSNSAGTKELVNQEFIVISSSAGHWGTLTPKCAPQARLDVYDAGTAAGVNVQIYQSNGTDAQKWRFIELDDGYYAIQSKASGKFLDVAGGNTASRTNVQQYTWNASYAQQWKLIDAGDGYYYICPRLNQNLCLDVYDAGTANYTNVWVYTRNDSVAQKWKFQ